MSKNVVIIVVGLIAVVLLCFYLQSVVVKQLMPQPTIYDNPTTAPAPGAKVGAPQGAKTAPTTTTTTTKTKISAPSKKH